MYIVFKISRISLKHIKLLSAPLNSLYITYYSVNSLLFEVKGICVYTDEYLFNSNTRCSIIIIQDLPLW